MNPPETFKINTEKFYFDCGGYQLGGSEIGPSSSESGLGHPRVYLTMARNGTVDCPYCGRHFVLDVDAKKTAEH